MPALQQRAGIKGCDIQSTAVECVGFDLSASSVEQCARYGTEQHNEEKCVCVCVCV